MLSARGVASAPFNTAALQQPFVKSTCSQTPCITAAVAPLSQATYAVAKIFAERHNLTLGAAGDFSTAFDIVQFNDTEQLYRALRTNASGCQVAFGVPADQDCSGTPPCFQEIMVSALSTVNDPFTGTTVHQNQRKKNNCVVYTHIFFILIAFIVGSFL